MFLPCFFVLFLVTLSSSTLTTVKPYRGIDDATLQNVFGSPSNFQQAVPVVPYNGTLVDPDYWDLSDDFIPSQLNYDMFDWSITKRVAAFSKDNFLLSPLGLKLALAVLSEAATGPTKTELISVLGFDLDRNKIRSKFSNILGSLQTKSSQYIFDLGSRIYVGRNVEPRQRLASAAEAFYKTQLTKIDFDNPPVAAKEINDWVANITKGRIPALVSDGDIAGLVVMILNTIYFRGTWRHQFAPNETHVAPFYVTPSILKQTQFMKIQDRFYCSDSSKFNAKILRMPYLGHKFSMYIVVPNSLTGLPHVMDHLSELRQEIQYLAERTVDVTLPKFQFDYTSHLDGVLRDMGIRQAFEDTASFPGIARGQSLRQRLRVSRILQKAGIEVNELGSIAYSATEISLVNKFGEDSDVVHEVIANKPFLFFIEDEVTRQLLFTGRFSDPSSAQTEFVSK